MRRLTAVVRRTIDQWRTGPSKLRARTSSEQGDTLVEVLCALVVVAIAGVALLAGFATSITASAQHRHLASLDSSMRFATNTAIADVQQGVQQFSSGAKDPFSCPSTFTPQFPSLAGSFQVTYTVGWWNGTNFQGPSPTYQGPNTCIPGAPQEYTLTVTSTSPNVNLPPTTVTTVISSPAAPASPTGAGAAYQLVWLQQPSGGSAQTPFTPQPEVAVEDQQGDIVSSDFSSVTLNLLQAPTGGTLSNTCSGVESYGIVQFSDCSVNKAGTYEIQAVDSLLQPTSGVFFSVTANPAQKLAFTTTAISGTASASATSGPITVQIQDAFGNPIPTTAAEVVSLSSSSSAGTFSLTSGGTAVTSVTIPAASASATFYYGDTVAGSPTITATPPVTSGLLAGQQQETISGGAATQLAITSPAFTGAASSSATNSFTVTLEDTFGNPTTKTTATTVTLSVTGSTTGKFAATSGGASTTTVSIPASTQSVTAFYGDTKTGTPTIKAAASGLTSATQQETITGGPTKLVFTTSPVSGSTSAVASLGLITVQEQAANGTPTTVGLTINLSSNSAGTPIFGTTQGASSGVTSVTIPGGSSSASFYYGDTNVGTPTITASSTGLSVMQQETITAGTGTQLAITSAPFSGKASMSATNAFTVTLEDAFGNATTSGTAITVNLSSNSTGTYEFAATSGSTQAVTSVRLPANTQSVTAYYGDTNAGTPTITAAANGLSSDTQQETITAGTGTQLAITSAPFSGAANSSATNAFTVTLEDAFGNATTKTTATTINLSSNSTGTHEFSATSGGANVTYVSLPANTASVTAFYGDEAPGTPTITAAATGLTPSGTQRETITAGSPAKLVFTTTAVSGPASSSATLGPITVQEQDAYGNVASSGSPTTVNLTSSSTGATFAASSGGPAITSVVIPGGNSTATFWYGDTQAGHPIVTPVVTGLTSATQQENITALAGSKLGVSTFSGGASSSATNAFTVSVEDAFGNVTTSGTAFTVNLSTTATTTGKFAATSGGATVTSVNLPANTQSVTAYYGDTLAGTPTITATTIGLNPGSQIETITGGTATHLVITSTAFSGGASSSATNAFTVTLEDAFNNFTTKTTATTVNLTSNSTGTHEFSATSGGATVASVNLPANTQSVTAYYGDTLSGTPTITAAATGLSPSATQQETITAGAAAQLIFTTTAKSGPASTSATLGPITVQEQDAFGNVSTTGLTVNLSSSSSAGVFAATSGGAGVTSVNIAAGNSTASFYYGDTKSGAPTITAGATGVTAGTQAEGITALTGTQLAITSTAFSAGASSSPTNAFTVTLEDTYGNATTKATATTVNLSTTATGTGKFAATSGGATVTSVTLPVNTASVTAYYGDTLAGTPTITAAATGLNPSGTQQETITGGTATHLAITSAAFSAGASSSATNAFTVSLEDAFNNITTKTTATTVNLTSNSTGTHEFAATSGGSTVTSVNLPANTQSVTAYYGDAKLGTPTITAAATGLSPSATQQETITPGVGTHLVITSTAFSGAANSSATNAFTVTLEDAFNNATTSSSATTVNLSTTDTGTGTFAATSGGGTVTSVNLLANTQSVTAYYGDTNDGTPTITAAATGLSPSATQQETITAGAAAQLVFTTTPKTGTASTSATLGPITVQEQDAYGNVSTTAITVNLSTTDTGTGKFAATSGGTGVTSVNIAAGNSTATFYYGDTNDGTPTITAAATGLSPSATQQETITAGTATHLAITSNAFSGTASNSATNAFTVSLEDAFNNITTKTTATTVNLSTTDTGTGKFAATSGGGTVASVNLPANTQSVTAYYGDTNDGTPTITAAATGLSPSATQQETITAGTATQLAITSTAFSGGASSSPTNAFTVTLEDAYGNVTTKATATTVNLSTTATGTGAFAATSGGATVTSVNLPANTQSVTAYYGDTKSGTPTITAAATGLNPSGTQQETITGGTATHLAITSNAFSGTASSSATNAFTVTLEDAFNNITTKTTATTVNLSTTDTGTGTFAATSGGGTVTSVNLPANTQSVTAYYGDTKPGTPTITAAATGLSPSATQQETITAGTATHLAITSNAFSGTASNSATNAFTVSLEDAFNNITTKTTATTVNLSTTDTGTGKFAATSGGGTVASVNLPANTQSVTAYYGDTNDGTPTITAAATGLSPSATQQETITAGTATQLAITSTAFSGGASSSPTNAFTVTLEDAFGNVTTTGATTTVNLSTTATGTGKFAATSGGATVTSVTLPANTQSVTAYYGDTKSGTPTITAAATGLNPSGTQQETITGGTATHLAVTSNAFSGTASNLATNAFTVSLEDAFNNITTKTTATTVNLSTTDTGTGTFAATSGGATVASVNLPANTQSVTAYYGDTQCPGPRPSPRPRPGSAPRPRNKKRLLRGQRRS